MGIKPLPSYRDYWHSSPDLRDHYISGLMSTNRFGWILSNIHLNDNDLMPGRLDPDYDKLYKIQPFLTKIAENFEKCLNPNEVMAVDESMIKFKGRSSLKQYLPKKPIKRGFKVWVLADKTGYAWKFEIYTGKKGTTVEKQLGERVVSTLSENIQGKNHRIYFDNYFTGTNLLQNLRKNGILACGTVNQNRRNLPKLKNEKAMKRGEYDYATSDMGLAMVKWKDKRAVHLLSNFHDPKETDEVIRKDKDGSQVIVPCPKVLSDYNQNMNCVDKFDQLKGTYELDRKSKKWWHRIFWYFIDASIVNAYILHKELGLEKMSSKDFRRAISQELVAPAHVASRQKNQPKRKSVPSATEISKSKPFVPKSIRLENSAHQPMRTTRRRCAKCSTKDAQVRTDWMCSICEVPLCLGKRKTCFQDFHI